MIADASLEPSLGACSLQQHRSLSQEANSNPQESEPEILTTFERTWGPAWALPNRYESRPLALAALGPRHHGEQTGVSYKALVFSVKKGFPCIWCKSRAIFSFNLNPSFLSAVAH